MALPSSGAISLSNIQTEFGGTNPIGLSEYYSKGNAPASGEIQLAADFYGTSNTVDLDLTLQGGNVGRANGTFTGVSIGTANANRMVIIQGTYTGSGTYDPPTLITLNGTAMTLLRGFGNLFIAYLKVPTGTTATIVIGGGDNVTFTQQIITLNTVNTGANQTSIQNGTAAPSGGTGTLTMTTNPVATDGVFIWVGNGVTQVASISALTSNSSGATITQSSITVGNRGSVMAYSECTTTDSRNAQISVVNSDTSGKINSFVYSVFAFFKAN
jgi:hypothetical protein